MAMRDPASNDDELHTRMTTLRDSPTTKHIQLMGERSLIDLRVYWIAFRFG